MTSTTEDYMKVTKLLEDIGGSQVEVACVTIDGEPRSKARPRFSGNGHAYTPTKQREAERILGSYLKSAFKKPYRLNVAVVCIFYRSTYLRVDTDNMLKHVLDAANGICWVDDYQVTGIIGLTELDKERPRTVIGFAQHESTLVRDMTPIKCEKCGKDFTRRHTGNNRFCSRPCSWSAAEQLSELKPCEHCQQSFRRRTLSQRFCTTKCRAGWLTGRNKNKMARASICVDCGNEVQRKASPRCRACWKIARASATVGA